MLTNQDSYTVTVSDDFERCALTPRLPSENQLRSFETPNEEPCHHMLGWEDSLDERPIMFKIRQYLNNEENSCTVGTLLKNLIFVLQYYQIEICTSS
jgi:hypothetical protein